MSCKRIMSLLLSFVMMAALIPGQLQFSYAEEKVTETESEIGTEIITETEPEINEAAEDIAQEAEEVSDYANLDTAEPSEVVKAMQTAEEEYEDEEENLDEEEIDYCGYGYRSEVHDYWVPPRSDDEVGSNHGNMPASYRTVPYLKINYPATRNQGNYGTCWAFSSMACAEFDMVKNHGFSSTTDFSELHLAYFMYNKLNDPLGGLNGDSNAVGLSNYNFANVGGNILYAINVLAQHCGPAPESAAKYSTIQNAMANGIDANKGLVDNKACLNNAYIMDISSSSGRDDVKAAVKSLGAVSISYYHDNNNYYTHSASGTVNYYSSVSALTNHVVTIVGWDDNYSKSNFKSGHQPKYNGAWLVRNSWTTSTGNSKYSYFWLSYYDKTIADAAYALDFVKSTAYDNNYQYDGAAVHRYIRTEKASNVFKAQKTTAENEERLKAVRISLSYDASVDYEIKVYKNLMNANDPESGQLVKSATTFGSTTHAGIYTIKLANEVPLDKGETFAIVVSFPNGPEYIDRECTYNSWIKTVAKADKGESFFYDDDEWCDNAEEGYGNLCIKALTVDYKSKVNRYAVKYELNGGKNTPGNPAFYEENTSTIKLLSPTRTGYHFLGWYLDPEFEKPINEITYAESGDLVVYAKWEKHSNVLVNCVSAVSCVRPGSETYECTICGEVQEKTITIPHDVETVITKATASKDGYSREVCMTCKRVIKTNYTIYKPTVALSYTSATYSGLKKTPAVTASNRKNQKLTKGSTKDYTVEYKNNLYPGTGKVVVKFNEKKYACTITKNFTIKPKATYITRLSGKNNAFYVKWNKRSSQITGYQIQYSRYSSFKNAGSRYVTSKTTGSKTIKKLKSNKKYYVRVRTYKNVKENGKYKKYHSSWSKVKTVKTR